jgi:hypothetical protein
VSDEYVVEHVAGHEPRDLAAALNRLHDRGYDLQDMKPHPNGMLLVGKLRERRAPKRIEKDLISHLPPAFGDPKGDA